VDIKTNNANAHKAEADGEASYISETGAAKGAEVEAVGMARAKAYKAQVAALGQGPTALVNSVDALSKSGVSFVPQILVAGGGNGGVLEGLAAQIMSALSRQPIPFMDSGSDDMAEKIIAEKPIVPPAGTGTVPVPPPPEETPPEDKGSPEKKK
jgi:hypothetical protein